MSDYDKALLTALIILFWIMVIAIPLSAFAAVVTGEWRLLAITLFCWWMIKI